MSGNALSHTVAYEQWLRLSHGVMLWFRSSDDVRISTVLDFTQKRLSELYDAANYSEIRVVYYFSEERMTNTSSSSSKLEVIKHLIMQIIRLNCKDNPLHEAITGLIRGEFTWTLREVGSILLHESDTGNLFDLLGIMTQNTRFPLIFAIENLDSIAGFEHVIERLSALTANNRHKVICSATNRPGSMNKLAPSASLFAMQDTEYQGE